MRWILAALMIVFGVAVSREAAATCRDPSRAVGYHHCRHFGQAWAREDSTHFTEGLDFLTHSYSASSLATARSSSPSSDDPRTTMAGMGWRFTGSTASWWYGGWELYGATAVKVPALAGMTVDDADSVGSNLILGAHVIERFRTQLSFELAAGVHADRFYACGACTTPEATQTRGDLTARARLDVFIYPVCSIAITYGEGMLSRDDHMAMISITGHAPALDGM